MLQEGQSCLRIILVLGIAIFDRENMRCGKSRVLSPRSCACVAGAGAQTHQQPLKKTQAKLTHRLVGRGQENGELVDQCALNLQVPQKHKSKKSKQ